MISTKRAQAKIKAYRGGRKHHRQFFEQWKEEDRRGYNPTFPYE